MDIIFSPSEDEKGMYDEFIDGFYAVRYENPLAKSEKMHLVNKLFLVLWNNIYIYVYFDNIVPSIMKIVIIL